MEPHFPHLKVIADVLVDSTDVGLHAPELRIGGNAGHGHARAQTDDTHSANAKVNELGPELSAVSRCLLRARYGDDQCRPLLPLRRAHVAAKAALRTCGGSRPLWR